MPENSLQMHWNMVCSSKYKICSLWHVQQSPECNRSFTQMLAERNYMSLLSYSVYVGIIMFIMCTEQRVPYVSDSIFTTTL